MAAGIGAGYFLRHRPLRYLGRIISVLIWILLFLLGVEVGGDERIVKGIASLGIEAVIITVAGVAGCGLLSLLLWKMVKKSKGGCGDER